MADTFRCHLCGRTFPNSTAMDVVAADEARKIWGVDPASSPELFGEVCDECWEQCRPEKHPELYRQAMREIHGDDSA